MRVALSDSISLGLEKSILMSPLSEKKVYNPGLASKSAENRPIMLCQQGHQLSDETNKIHDK